MSVLIKGMEMPVFENQSLDVRKGADGKWYMVDTNAETSDGEWHEIVPVPPHGRLIDADALARFLLNKYWDSSWISSSVLDRFASEIANAPTIIPAEEGET